MKKVGIIGGMGPESTIPYYHDIVYGVKNILSKDVFPAITIESIDVFKVLDLCEKKLYLELRDYLYSAVTNLCKCNCDFIVMAANTPHIVFDELQKLCNIPMLSIVNETAKYAYESGMKHLALFGTKTTMLAEYYRKPFIEHGISVIVPDEKDMDFISSKISTELERGIINENTRNELIEIMVNMKQRYAIDGVILGCTELPLIITKDTVPVPCLDTMEIHINSIIKKILS